MNKETFDSKRCSGAIFWEDALIITSQIQARWPVKVIELGVFMGLGTLVILDALLANGMGFEFVSVDIKGVGEEIGGGKFRSSLVDTFAPVSQVKSDAIKYLKGLPDDSIDMIIEDTTHKTDYTSALIPAILRVLKPGGVALFHDLKLDTMKRAFSNLMLDDRLELFPPSWMGMLEKPKGKS